MKRRQIGSILLCVCLLLGGCGAGKEAVETARQEPEASKAAQESAAGEAMADAADLASEQKAVDAINELTLSEMETDVLAKVEQAIAEQSAVLEAYETVLAEWPTKEPWSKEIPSFALIYLDNDDIPELAVMRGTAHSHGASIFTYEHGEAVFVEEYGQYGEMDYREREGVIFDEWDQGGIYHTWVYRIDGSRRTLLLSCSLEADFLDEANPKYVYKVEDVEVSEEQYWEALARYETEEMRRIRYYDKHPLITEPDIRGALTKELEALILTQRETVKQRVLAASGMTEDMVLLMDYDDYDHDGKCEAFMFCGEYNEYNELNKIYSGELWFAGAEECTRLRREQYRMIDGSMVLGRQKQKYIYLYTDEVFTANYSELWTVEAGKPVEVKLPQCGQIIYREGDSFEVWADGYDHSYRPKDDLWIGHTYRPYFYHYNWDTKMLERYGENLISAERLARICGFDLAAEIEAEGYEITEIVYWDNDIVTVNYTIPRDENDPVSMIDYENIIWDCRTGDYWRKEERGVTSWKNAGFGGSF